MNEKVFPVIDPVATGKNIIRLRTERGLSVRDLQSYFGFEEPQAIYKWQQGKSLPNGFKGLREVFSALIMEGVHEIHYRLAGFARDTERKVGFRLLL